MTVAGRRPPSRWSWRSALGAFTMVASSSIERWYAAGVAAARTVRPVSGLVEALPRRSERSGHANRCGPADDVTRGEGAVDRGGGPESLAESGFRGERGGRGIVTPGQGRRDGRVADHIQTDPVLLGGRDQGADEMVSGTDRDTATDHRVGDGRRGRVALAGSRAHPLGVD